MERAPAWYHLIQAAKYLGVAPWDLLERPQAWQGLAVSAMKSEAYAEKQKEEQEKKKRGKKKG